MRGVLAVAQVAASLSAAIVGIAQPALPSALSALQPLVGAPHTALADISPGGTTATQITGTVFQDFNSSGVMDTSGITLSLAIDIGVSGITVSAYGATGATPAATATTNASGTYTLTGLTSGAPYRIEFSNLPQGYYPTSRGNSNATIPSNGTTIQFARAGSSNVSLGINRPCDYCQSSPSLITSIYQSGNPLAGGETGTLPDLVQWPYLQSGTTAPTSRATASQIGATWGLAYQRETQTIFSSAFVRRHVGLGPSGTGNGLGAIYRTNGANTSLFVDVMAAPFSINLGSMPSNVARGLSGNPDAPSVDAAAFDGVGKVGMGDIELSDDGGTLYLVNLNLRNVVALNINNPAVTPTSATTYDLPNFACTLGTLRPWGLKFRDNYLYVGAVCSGEAEPYPGGSVIRNNGNLRALVFAMDTTATVPAFNPTPVLNFPLNFPRGCAANPYDGDQRNCAWNPWTNQFTDRHPTSYDEFTYPSPILSGIEFDYDGSMILGFSDRWGMQLGTANYWPDGSSGEYAVEGGDILRAYPTGVRQWTIENGGDKDGPGPYTPTANQINAQGPGGGEFYYSEFLGGYHAEIGMGALAILPGSQRVASTENDPLTGNSNGTALFSSINGSVSNGYQLRLGKNTRSFGKAAGLGDLELMCNPAPVGIGNRVWVDANRNGIQDAGEQVLVNVSVTLTDNAGRTFTTTTDSLGEYYFNNSNVTGGLHPTQTYTVAVNTSQPVLADYRLTTPNVVTTSTTLSDSVDSDGVLIGASAIVTVTPAGAGQNNHTIDFGFYKLVFSLGNRVWYDTNNDGLDNDGPAGALGAGIAGVTVTLLNAANIVTATTSTDANGYYRFDNLPPGGYTVVLTDSNFGPGGVLMDYHNSTPTFNDAADANDNGAENGVLGSGGDVRSAIITLTEGGVPVGETGGGFHNPLGDDLDDLTVDFGFYKLTLGNRVWLDTNRNGLDDAETGLAGIPVTLTNAVSVVLATTTTDANGYYTFTNLISNSYIVRIQAPTYYLSSLPDDGSADIDQNDNGQGNAGGTIDSQLFSLTPGAASADVIVNSFNGSTRNPTIDFGLYMPSADLLVYKTATPATYQSPVGGSVTFNVVITNFGPDRVVNALFTDTQPPLPALVAFLSWTCAIRDGAPGDACGAASGTGDIATTLTLTPNASALFTITALIPLGTATIVTNTARVSLPPNVAQAPINRQDVDTATVVPTQTLYSVGNRVWFDTNDDGATTGIGTPIAAQQVLMELRDANSGQILQTMLTDGNGYYRFDNVLAGSYQVFIAASNFQPGGPLEGYRNSTGVSTTTDLASDNHDHGLNVTGIPAIDGIGSVTVTLGPLLEPTGEVGIGGGDDGPHGDAQSNLTIDFGLNLIHGGNQLWFDTDNDGIYEPGAGERPVPAGIIVNLHVVYFNLGVDRILLTTTTDANGQYEFRAENISDLALVRNGSALIYGAIPPGQPLLNSYIPSTPRVVSGGQDSHNTGALDATGLITSGLFFPLPGETTNGALVTDTLGETYQPTIDFGFVLETYSLGNRVWYDTNDNGILDGGESPVPGVTMKLFDSTNTEISSTVTDAGGYYRFDGLLAGSYSVQVAASNFISGGILYGYRNSTATTPSSGVLADDDHDHGINTGRPGVDGIFAGPVTVGHNLQPTSETGPHAPDGDAIDNLTLDFGFYRLALGNLVWVDEDNNGTFDANDRGGLDGVPVRLYASDGVTEIPVGADGVWGTADDAPGGMWTHDGGLYEFSGLTPGAYVVQIDLLDGFVSSSGVNAVTVGPYEPAPDPINNIDNDDNGSNPDPGIRVASSALVTLTPGVGGAAGNTVITGLTGSTTNPTLDFGIYNDLVLGNLIWNDLNNNGLWDSATEPGIPGVVVNLYFDANGDGDVNDGIETVPISTTTTDLSGLYLFTYIPPGNYLVELAASNFQLGGQLMDYTSSTGQNASLTGPYEPPRTPDRSATDNDDNGQISGTLGIDGVIRTRIFYMDAGREPLNENPDNEPYRLDENENLAVDFGVFRPTSVGNYTWIDLNQNGVQDPGEPPLQSVFVELLGPDGRLIANTNTDANGFYSFTNVLPTDVLTGPYTIRFTPPPGYTYTEPNLGGNDELDSNADPSTGLTDPITLIVNEPDSTQDAGFLSPLALGNLVWADVNNNGRVDAGEYGIPNVAVELYRDANGDGVFSAGDVYIKSTTTNVSGFYTFTNLAPTTGLTTSYIAVITGTNFAVGGPLHQYQNSTGAVPITNTLNSQDNGIDGTLTGLGTAGFVASRAMSLTDTLYFSFTAQPLDDGDTPPNGAVLVAPFIGVTDTLPNSQFNNWTIDFGFYRLQLGNLVWEDVNNDGDRDVSEVGLSGVAVTLYASNGTTVISTTTTDANGLYTFTGMLSGTYIVGLTPPTGYGSSLGSNNAFEPGASTFTGATDGTDHGTNAAGEVRSAPITLRPGDATTNGNGNTITPASGTTANPTVDFGLFQVASLGDRVWNDLNRDGIQDKNETAGVPGVQVVLYNALTNTPIATTTTDANGIYTFTNLAPGSYFVQFGLPPGYARSPADAAGLGDELDSDANAVTGRTISLTLISGQNDLTWDAGIYQLARLGDRVWYDTNPNGLQDSNEVTGVAGVQVVLYNALTNAPIATTTTNANGLYTFTNLIPGSYFVQFGLAAGYVRSPADVSGTGKDSDDSDANVTTGRTVSVTLIGGENDPSWDAGIYRPSTLGDRVWQDNNGNGTQDAGEPGIADVTVMLYLNGTPVSTTQTNGSGNYSFTNLIAGLPYSVVFTLPPAYAGFSPINIGSDTTDSDANPTTGATGPIVLTPGENNPNVDAGVYQLARLGDRVWYDVNRNGIQDSSEVTGVAGVQVVLYNTITNLPVATTTTNANGLYTFTNLVPGSYFVQFGLPAGYGRSPADVSGTGKDTDDSDANVTTGRTVSVALVSGENDPTWDAGIFELASLGDRVWFDTNLNGIQDSNEVTGVVGVQVVLYNALTNLPVATTTTGANGFYSFTNLIPGSYFVEFVLPAGYVRSPADVSGTGKDADDSDANVTTGRTVPVTLVGGENDSTWDAGIGQLSSLGDRVWNDRNGNGTQDSGEPGIAGVTVTLYLNGTPISTTQTDGSGFFGFANLTPTVPYSIVFTVPPGYIGFTPVNVGSDATDSDANPTTGATGSIVLQPGENNPTVDAGVLQPGGIGDHVWVDENGDGQQQPAEPGVPGVTVTLYLSGTPFITTTTDPGGFYSFTNLIPGLIYTVHFDIPNGFTWTVPTVGITTTDSNVDQNGNTPPVPILGGDEDSTIDAGVVSIVVIDKVGVGSGLNGAIGPDQQITYTIRVTNTGAGAVNGVSVNDVLPSTMTYLRSVQTPPAGTSPLRWDLGTLAAGESRTIVFVVQTTVNTGTLVNVASVVGLVGNQPVVYGNDTATTPFAPNAVTLLQFTAQPVEDGVQVMWQTGSEINTFGFALYRAETNTRGQATLVSGEMIPAVGASTYTFVDRSAVQGKSYYYWLIEVETTGALLEYGPTAMTPSTNPGAGVAPGTTTQPVAQPMAGIAIGGGVALQGLPTSNGSTTGAQTNTPTMPASLPSLGVPTNPSQRQTQVGVETVDVVNPSNTTTTAHATGNTSGNTTNGTTGTTPEDAVAQPATMDATQATQPTQADPASNPATTTASENMATNTVTVNSDTQAAVVAPAPAAPNSAAAQPTPRPASNPALPILGILGSLLLLAGLGLGGLILIARKRRTQ